jgi:hypothetical protein
MRLVGAAGTTVVGLAVAWWVYARLTARAELEHLLEDSGTVFATRVYVQSLPPGQVAEKDKWLLSGDGIRRKAQEHVGLTNRTTPEEAFAVIQASLPKIPPQVVEQMLPGLLGKGLDALSETLGIQVPRSVQAQVQGMAQTPQGQQLDGLVTSAHGLWEWQRGTTETKQ